MFIIFIKNLAYYIYLSTNFQKIFRTVDWVDEHDNYFIGPVTSRKFTFSSFGGRYLQCVCVFNIYSTNWIRKPISSQLPTLQNNMISQCHFRIVSAIRESWKKEKMQTIQFITKFKKKKILFYAEIKPWVTKAEWDKHWIWIPTHLQSHIFIIYLFMIMRHGVQRVRGLAPAEGEQR